MKRPQRSVPRYTLSDRMVSLVAEITEIAIVEGRNETKQEPQGETARRPAAPPPRPAGAGKRPSPPRQSQPTTRCLNDKEGRTDENLKRTNKPVQRRQSCRKN